PNLFLYDLDQREHYQLTNVPGGIAALTEFSPAISWARQADRLAFTYYEDSKFTIWTVNNPRSLRRAPFRQPSPALVAATLSMPDSAAKPVSIAALLDSMTLGLPDTSRFR